MPLTDDQIPAGLTRDEARAVREWAERARGAEVQDETVAHAARVLLAVLPKRPTLADMSMEERAACQWMQCEVRGFQGQWVLATLCDDDDEAGLVSACGEVVWSSPAQVTPRHDLPRLEWPDGQESDEDMADEFGIEYETPRVDRGVWDGWFFTESEARRALPEYPPEWHPRLVRRRVATPEEIA